MNVSSIRPRPEPLPATPEEYASKRKSDTVRTLNDMVDEIHVMLYSVPEYRAFLDAVYDEDAVEGSLSADNIEAARMVREKARKTGNTELANKKLATIVKSLNVVQRRFGLSRNDRRNMVNGVIVPEAFNPVTGK